MRRILRNIRGAVGNAVVWATSWFAATFTVWSALHLLGGLLPVAEPWGLITAISAGAGFSGFVSGLVFSGFLRAAYSGRSLLDLSVPRLALAGAAVAGALSVAGGFALQLLFGVILPIGAVATSAIMPALLGALTAGGSIRAAQGAERRLAGTSLDALEAEQAEARDLLRGATGAEGG